MSLFKEPSPWNYEICQPYDIKNISRLAIKCNGKIILSDIPNKIEILGLIICVYYDPWTIPDAVRMASGTQNIIDLSSKQLKTLNILCAHTEYHNIVIKKIPTTLQNLYIRDNSYVEISNLPNKLNTIFIRATRITCPTKLPKLCKIIILNVMLLTNKQLIVRSKIDTIIIHGYDYSSVYLRGSIKFAKYIKITDNVKFNRKLINVKCNVNDIYPVITLKYYIVLYYLNSYI